MDMRGAEDFIDIMYNTVEPVWLVIWLFGGL